MKKIMLLLMLVSGTALAQTPEVFVVSVQPRFVTVQQQRCETVLVQPQDNSTAGAVVGGLAGGLLGHQIGRGSGNTAATIAGAVGGTVLGSNMGKPDPAPQARQTCSYVPVQVQQGETVTFSYKGRLFSQVFQ
jgi:uncharacterized protein YcfJ